MLNQHHVYFRGLNEKHYWKSALKYGRFWRDKVKRLKFARKHALLSVFLKIAMDFRNKRKMEMRR